MNLRFSLLLLLFFNRLLAQDIKNQLEKVTQNFLNSPMMLSGNLSFMVTEENSKTIFEYQSKKLLSTASSQKVMTAIAMYELLGPNYQYVTKLSYTGKIENQCLNGDLILHSNGDPTLGSWRYNETVPKIFESKIIEALQKNNINKIQGNVIIDDTYFGYQTHPGGWPWNDMGNYYGAGVWGVNWNENQLDLHIKANQLGSQTEITKISHDLMDIKWKNNTIAGPAASGDQSYIFTAPYSEQGFVEGTLPANKTTIISGAMPNPPLQLLSEIKVLLAKSNINIEGNYYSIQTETLKGNQVNINDKSTQILEIKSPKLSEILQWFLRKSVNFYGETFIKTLAVKFQSKTDNLLGIAELNKFYTSKKIPKSSFSFADGSGLSPQNYASAFAQVSALNYAQKQDWFPLFYENLPTYNGMKMKSGTIKNCKAYAGYHTAKSGKKYTFSILVNNYYSGDINKALFQILDVLK